MTFEVKVTSRRWSSQGSLTLFGIAGTLVTWRKKSCWRCYGRCWNRIPNVEVLIVGLEIINLELFLVALTTSPNAGREGLQELDAVAGRRRFQFAHRLFRLRHATHGT